jgi:hypothetical protein
MASRPQTGNINSSSSDKDAGLPTVLLGTDVMGARDVSWSHLCFIWLCLAAKPSHMGANVDRLAYFQHHPAICGWQTWVQCSLTSDALSHHTLAVGGAFSVGARSPRLDICCGEDRLGTREIKSYMEKLAFIRMCLSRVRVIMTIMRVPLVE